MNEVCIPIWFAVISYFLMFIGFLTILHLIIKWFWEEKK